MWPAGQIGRNRRFPDVGRIAELSIVPDDVGFRGGGKTVPVNFIFLGSFCLFVSIFFICMHLSILFTDDHATTRPIYSSIAGIRIIGPVLTVVSGPYQPVLEEAFLRRLRELKTDPLVPV